MNHQDHVALIRNAIPQKGGIWADLGSGAGAFTLALADVTNQQAEIYSIDKDTSSLQEQKEQFETIFPDTNIHFIQEDFTESLELPLFDGILMEIHCIMLKIRFGF